ncbi:glycosyltransferase family 2 protein [Arthrobacter sp. Z1-15]
MSHKVLSVVVPMYNEEAVLNQLVSRLRPVLDGLGVPYEVVAVDDGSKDATATMVQQMRGEWPELRLIRLMRNSGHQAAITAGMSGAVGDYVVTIDADLQDPPEAIEEMLEKAQAEEVDVVYGVRSDRSTDSVFKRQTAALYYWLMRRVAGPHVPSNAGDFRLVSRRVLEAINKLPEEGRVYRLIIPWFGFPSTNVYYQRDKRAAGTSKYPLGKMILLTTESIVTFSGGPLRFATWLGVLSALLCVLVGVFVIVGVFTGQTVPGWASTVLVVGGIGAIQLFCLGILGEYIGRIFAGTLRRPLYLVGYDSMRADDSASAPGHTGFTEANGISDTTGEDI